MRRLGQTPAPRKQQDSTRSLTARTSLAGSLRRTSRCSRSKNGEIVGRTKRKPLKKNEFLVTDKSYGDFVLKAKVKIQERQFGHPVSQRAQA